MFKYTLQTSTARRDASYNLLSCYRLQELFQLNAYRKRQDLTYYVKKPFFFGGLTNISGALAVLVWTSATLSHIYVFQMTCCSSIRTVDSSDNSLVHLWQSCIAGCGHNIYFRPVSFFFFPRLISAAADWMSTILRHMVWHYSPNLECRSEMCCTRLARNTGRKDRHFGTIAQVCRAISSELRHVSTIWKKLVKQQYLLHMPW